MVRTGWPAAVSSLNLDIEQTNEVEGHNLLFVKHHLFNIVRAPWFYAMNQDLDGTLFVPGYGFSRRRIFGKVSGNAFRY